VKEQTPFLRPKGLEAPPPSPAECGRWSVPLFRAAWYWINILLVIALSLALWSTAWEYSTHRYLKGFSDAVVPESASDEAKIQAILDWFSYGPARRMGDDPSLLPNRDPTETLNYAKLLRTCGTATNAFVNLADASGLQARRLLLLDSNLLTRHVVAEVFVEGRWIVVDPAFHRVLRGSDRHPLTREELAQPAIWSSATGGIPGYNPSYTYNATAHVRLSRLYGVGRPLRAILDRVYPRWEDSSALSLLLERKSLAELVASVAFLMLILAARLALRRYGENRLRIRTTRLTDQMKRAIFLSFSRESDFHWDAATQPHRNPYAPAGTALPAGATPDPGTTSAPTSTAI
jgi:Transglutaminase-like superfamily